ncbi:MAG TPA: hypothetical protein VKM54_20380 [Myxococcota bacterium]|nr:hypothetical protein [Myxococcota bacterium]
MFPQAMVSMENIEVFGARTHPNGSRTALTGIAFLIFLAQLGAS